MWLTVTRRYYVDQFTERGDDGHRDQHPRVLEGESGCCPLNIKHSVPARECGSLERTAGIAIEVNRSYRVAFAPAVLQNHNDALVDKRSQIGVFAASLLYHRS